MTSPEVRAAATSKARTSDSDRAFFSLGGSTSLALVKATESGQP